MESPRQNLWPSSHKDISSLEKLEPQSKMSWGKLFSLPHQNPCCSPGWELLKERTLWAFLHFWVWEMDHSASKCYPLRQWLALFFIFPTEGLLSSHVPISQVWSHIFTSQVKKLWLVHCAWFAVTATCAGINRLSFKKQPTFCHSLPCKIRSKFLSVKLCAQGGNHHANFAVTGVG